MHKHKKISKILILSFLLLILFFCIFYIKSINIFEPIDIDFSGISAADKKNIELYSISPFNHQSLLNYEKSAIGSNFNNLYHKKIGFIIPDSILNKINSVRVTLNGEKYEIPLEKLIPANKIDGHHDYVLPEYVKSTFTFYKMAKLFLSASIFRYLLIILLCLTAIILIINQILLNKNEKIKIKLKQILPWIKTLFFSVIIAFSLYFGYLLFKFSLATYITSLLLVFYIIIFLWLLIIIVLKIFNASVKTYFNVKKILIVTGIIWICIETLLRISGLNQSYNEKNGLFYISGYKVNSSNIDSENPDLYCHRQYSTFFENRKEFSYKIKTNNIGLRDEDHPIAKPDSEFRIICLGNSFTEGIGAPQDSTWPCLLEDKLKNITNNKTSVFNAGISSSDPFFQYNLLYKKLLNYSPDLVFLTLSSSDFEFYNFRGGFERFTPQGLKFRNAPPWERLYAASFIFRYYINNILKYKNLLPKSENDANYFNGQNDIYNCILKFYELSLKNKFKLIVVFVDDNMTHYFPIISKLKQQHKIPFFDLFEYNKSIAGITTNNRSKYYWETDGHCNSNGYNLFAEGVLWNLKKMGVVDAINPK